LLARRPGFELYAAYDTIARHALPRSDSSMTSPARFPAWLLRTDDSPGAYIGKRLAAVMIPTVGTSALALAVSHWFFESAAVGPTWDSIFDFHTLAGALEFVAVAVVIAPAAETLVMVPLLVVARTARAPRWLQVLVPALFMAWRHGQVNVLWGFVQIWPFLIYSAALVAWWDASRWRAVESAFAIHALNNLIAVAIILAVQNLPG
jgi:hypothetical protein